MRRCRFRAPAGAMRIHAAAWLLVAAVLVLPGPARAQPAAEPPFACREDRSGVLQCIAGRLCVCRFERGGALSASPTSGWRWDCGILRPSCGPEDEVPATLRGNGTIAPEDAIPDSIILDLRGTGADADDGADDPAPPAGGDPPDAGDDAPPEDDGGDPPADPTDPADPTAPDDAGDGDAGDEADGDT